jgi:hypothetical protein
VVANQTDAYDYIKRGGYTIDSAEASLKKKGPVSKTWAFFFATLRANPNISLVELQDKSRDFCRSDYFEPEPVVRTKDEQYCYESSFACPYSQMKSCENACNYQMRANRNYLRN